MEAKVKKEENFICVLRTLCGCEKVFETSSEPFPYIDVPIVENLKDVLKHKKSIRTFELLHREGEVFFYREMMSPMDKLR